jgi:hypothetical protein
VIELLGVDLGKLLRLEAGGQVPGGRVVAASAASFQPLKAVISTGPSQILRQIVNRQRAHGDTWSLPC